MTKKAILLMTFGSPEGYTFEDIARFFTNIRRGVRPTDQEIVSEERMCFHPNTNEKTIFVNTEDLFTFLKAIGYEAHVINL